MAAAANSRVADLRVRRGSMRTVIQPRQPAASAQDTRRPTAPPRIVTLPPETATGAAAGGSGAGAGATSGSTGAGAAGAGGAGVAISRCSQSSPTVSASSAE